MKVNQRLLRNLACNVAFGLYLFHFLHGRVVRIDVGAMMLVVVQLHDLAGDGGLEGAIVVCALYSPSAMD